MVTGPQVHEDCCDNQNPYVEVLPDTVRLKCWLFRIVEKYSGSTYNSVEKIVLMINNSFKRKNHNIQSSLTYWVHKQASFFKGLYKSIKKYAKYANKIVFKILNLFLVFKFSAWSCLPFFYSFPDNTKPGRTRCLIFIL